MGGLVVELLLEFLAPILWEILADLSLAGGKVALDRTDRYPFWARISLFAFGSLAGGFSLLMRPERVVPPGPIPGLSLIVAPLISGAAMSLWGLYRRANHHLTSHLATFWGGALFGLGMALVRFGWAR